MSVSEYDNAGAHSGPSQGEALCGDEERRYGADIRRSRMEQSEVRDGEMERLFDEYYEKVYVYIALRVTNANDAEDLTSDVFLKAFANPYDPRLARFSTYVYTIAANTLKNHYRSAATRKIIVLGEPDGELPDGTDLLGDLITREEYAELKAALERLPERQYTAVYRRYYLDESFKEIGAAMGITENNARQLHFEAIKKLKIFLESPNETITCVYNQSEGGGEHEQ